MQQIRIAIVNVLSTGTAFAVTLEEPTKSVFVPAKLSEQVKLRLGDVFVAKAVPNPVNSERTPLMAVDLLPALPLEDPVPAIVARQTDLKGKVRDALLEGNTWTLEQMVRYVSKSPDGATYAEVREALNELFREGVCSKFQRLSSPTGAPVREWFSAYPDKVEVEEWLED